LPGPAQADAATQGTNPGQPTLAGDPHGKIMGLTALLALRAAYRQAGRRVVWTNGCFDLLHAGHVRNLQAARLLGDVLIVGLNSDDSVRALKGTGRPIRHQQDRAEVLAGLECVDHVLVFAENTPAPTLAVLQPEVHCKGAEYAPPNGRPFPEGPIVEGYGGRVVFLPLTEGTSTTELVRRIRDR
jgi:D-beta-D-heptose 7-phosphate kinase/D-beta-D-heptose 1-phosphate adenosyltransferase